MTYSIAHLQDRLSETGNHHGIFSRSDEIFLTPQIDSKTKNTIPINEQGHQESRMAEIEFKRKDHPDYSIAIDSQNKENTTQIYLVAGSSRTATEIENKTVKQPYAEQINNERLKRAQENPDDEKNPEQEADPHEPTLEPGSNNHY